MEKSYLLKGGRVIDPTADRDGIFDVLVTGTTYRRHRA